MNADEFTGISAEPEPTGGGARENGNARPGASSLYGALYYEQCCGHPYDDEDHWRNFFGRVATEIVRTCAPLTSIDVGCAYGYLVEALGRLGVNSRGVDTSEFAVGRGLAIGHRRLEVFDLSEGAYPLAEGRFAVATCIEVAEHVAAHRIDAFLDNLCALADTLVFSSSPHDHVEPTHVNVQPPEYWTEKFLVRGFVKDIEADAAYLTPWACVFRRESWTDPMSARALIRRYDRALSRVTEGAALLRRRNAELMGDVQSSAEGARAQRAESESESIALRERLQAAEATLEQLTTSLEHMTKREEFARHELASLRFELQVLAQSHQRLQLVEASLQARLRAGDASVEAREGHM